MYSINRVYSIYYEYITNSSWRRKTSIRKSKWKENVSRATLLPPSPSLSLSLSFSLYVLHTHAYRFDMYDTICGCREAMDPEYRGNVCALTTRVNGRLKGQDACTGHVLTLDRGGHPLPFFWELFSSRFPSKSPSTFPTRDDHGTYQKEVN